MAHLAIRGHATRGKEVIEILEMLGGKTRHGKLEGHELSCGYYINVAGYVGFRHYSLLEDTTIFTLEEFLKKYPYKVGDKVIYHESESEIVSMKWDGVDVVYTINHNDELWDTIVSNLQPYKEAPMYLSNSANKQAEEIGKILEPVKKIMKEIKLDIPDGYEFFGIDDDNKIVLTKKQPQYPKTYEECCKVLDIQSDWHLTFELNNPTSCDLCVKNEFEYVCKLEAFRKLLICRDAYWDIAGERMGLGKPWEPDWLNTEQDKFVLYTHNNVICSNRFVLGHNVLAFPTEEMRDAFLENFKELIELCKELL